MSHTYFAVFYVIGIILFAVFVRLWLSKKRFREEERKIEKARKSPGVYREMAKKIAQDARDHRRKMEKDPE